MSYLSLMTFSQVKDRTLSKSFLTEQHLSGQAREDFLVKLEKTIRDAPKTWIDKEVSHVPAMLSTSCAETVAEGHLRVRVPNRRVHHAQEAKLDL